MTQNHKILVVDDEADWLGTCRHELEKAGYAVVTAGGGEAAIETLKQGGFDLVLLDITMPGVDGYKVMEYINDNNIRIAMVVHSTTTVFDHVTRAFHLGAFDYVKKPVDFDNLRHVLNNALRKQELEKSLYYLRKQLERSERLHRFMIESSPDIIFIVDRKGNFAFVNDRAQDLLNYKKDELIGAHYSTIVDPEFIDRASHCFNERRSGPRATRDA